MTTSAAEQNHAHREIGQYLYSWHGCMEVINVTAFIADHQHSFWLLISVEVPPRVGTYVQPIIKIKITFFLVNILVWHMQVLTSNYHKLNSLITTHSCHTVWNLDKNHILSSGGSPSQHFHVVHQMPLSSIYLITDDTLICGGGWESCVDTMWARTITGHSSAVENTTGNASVFVLV